jgi:hypothetical protein
MDKDLNFLENGKQPQFFFCATALVNLVFSKLRQRMEWGKQINSLTLTVFMTNTEFEYDWTQQLEFDGIYNRQVPHK